MKVLIHDLDSDVLNGLFPNISKEVKIISPEKEIKKCIGCFGCWIKTPDIVLLKMVMRIWESFCRKARN